MQSHPAQVEPVHAESVHAESVHANRSQPHVPHVVIIGGGFGGLYTAKSLAKMPVRITLIDRHNYHLFQPLLYQVAMAGLSPGDIAEPLRGILRRNSNTRVLLGEVTHIDTGTRQVVIRDGETVVYDYLILAAGASHSYFGHDEWAQSAPGLKTLRDAIDIRQRVLTAFEEAERTQDPDERASLLTFVVVGGGPTGVELAGTLGEMANLTLRNNFRSFNPATARVILVDAGERILATYPPELSEKAVAALDRLGVQVILKALVTRVTAQGVTFKQGDASTTLAARTVLWAAGVQSSPLGKIIAEQTGTELDRAGRVKVASDFSLPGHPELFVIGDLAHFAHGTDQPLPGLAPVAMQQGKHLAKVVAARLNHTEAPQFRYQDRGTMATIGRNSAVAVIGRYKFNGLLAWWAWLVIHVIYLAEFDNRILVLFQWFWNYTTYRRGVRLIVTNDPRAGNPREDSVPGDKSHRLSGQVEPNVGQPARGEPERTGVARQEPTPQP